MKVLIVGLGSIARKHIIALQQLDPSVAITALRSSNKNEEEPGIKNISDWPSLQDAPSFILISNPTKLHAAAIKEALKYNCPLFIEKPVVASLEDAEDLKMALIKNKAQTYIACNLRFHPCIRFVKDYIGEKKLRINEVNVYCGSDLSKWRPGQDYTKSYSADAGLGGGVDLDLIHEVDYCYWLFGRPDETVSLKRKTSSLSIKSNDFAAYHLCYPQFTVNIVLNYYRPTLKRSVELVTESGIVYVDLVSATVTLDGVPVFSDPEFKMEQTYLQQMKYFVSNIKGGQGMMNDFSEASEVLKIAVG